MLLSDAFVKFASSLCSSFGHKLCSVCHEMHNAGTRVHSQTRAGGNVGEAVGSGGSFCGSGFGSIRSSYRNSSVQNTILPNGVQWSCCALSLITGLQLSGTSSLFLSVILPLSVLSNLPFRFYFYFLITLQPSLLVDNYFVRGHFRPNSSPQSCL